MISNVREFVDVLCKHKISANQFLICMLIHEKDVPATIKYFEQNKKNGFTYEEIDDLVEREYLLRLSRDTQSYELDQFTTTGKFMEDFLVDIDDAGEEFWNAFPSWIYMNSRKVSAKSCDKDELIEKYAKKIKGSKKKHEKVMATLKKYVEKSGGYATMGIDKFVSSEQWSILQEEYANDAGSGDLISNI